MKVLFALIVAWHVGQGNTAVSRIGTYENPRQCIAQAAIIQKNVAFEDGVWCLPVNGP